MNRIIPINSEPITTRGINPTPTIIPAVIDQKRYTRSRGSLTTVLKRTMDRAPTMPRDAIRFDDTAKITRVVIKFIPIKVIPKDDEYITPV